MMRRAKRVLIVNQHGENRGDEAAMRATIRAIEARFPGSSFVVLVQVRDRNLPPAIRSPDVEFRSIYLPIQDAIALVIFAMLAAVGVRLPAGLLPGAAAALVTAYRHADVVITAPGGPYFGDIYAEHEVIHWFYVYLARLHHKPVFQYAPSCGPFRLRLMNWLRRRGYRWIDVLVVREELSREYLQDLLGPAAVVHVTIDAAVQEQVPAAARESYFAGGRTYLHDRFIVAVTLHRHRFPGEVDPVRKQAQFERAILLCLERLTNERPCHFLLFPQLSGSENSDVSFHRSIGSRLPAGTSWEVVDPTLDSDRQRELFGLADFCVASRYHPQIFATSHGVPGLFVSYEHKQKGYLQQLGMSDYVFDICDPDESRMVSAVVQALERRDELSASLRERMKTLRHLSRRTTDLLEDFVLCQRTDHAGVHPSERRDR